MSLGKERGVVKYRVDTGQLVTFIPLCWSTLMIVLAFCTGIL